MTFAASLSFWMFRGAPRRAPQSSRPRRPVRETGRLAAEVLEDRTLPSAGFGAELLPRLSGGPQQGRAVQSESPPAVQVNNTLNTGGQGFGGAVQGGQQAIAGGKGYPTPLPTGPALTNDLLRAVQPSQVLNSALPSGEVVQGVPVSPNPMLSSGTTAAAVAPASFPAGTGFRVPGAVEIGPGGVQVASARVDTPPGGAPRSGDFTNALVMRRTDDTPGGVRADVSADFGRSPRLAPVQADPVSGNNNPSPLALQSGLERWTFAQVLMPEAEWGTPGASGEVSVSDAQADDLAGLPPLEQLVTPGPLPGTPNLAASLSPLAAEGDQAVPETAGSATFRNLALGALFAVGALGFGQFRDSLSRKANPQAVPGLRPREEEDR